MRGPAPRRRSQQAEGRDTLLLPESQGYMKWVPGVSSATASNPTDQLTVHSNFFLNLNFFPFCHTSAVDFAVALFSLKAVLRLA